MTTADEDRTLRDFLTTEQLERIRLAGGEAGLILQPGNPEDQAMILGLKRFAAMALRPEHLREAREALASYESNFHETRGAARLYEALRAIFVDDLLLGGVSSEPAARQTHP